METGEFKIGINPEKSKTGKGAAVRVIKVKSTVINDLGEEEEAILWYALSSKNFFVYKADSENDFQDGMGDPKIDAFKKVIEEEGKYKSYLGYDFGEEIPTTVVGYKDMLEDIFGSADSIDEDELNSGHLIFLGEEPNEDGPDEEPFIRLCWATKKDKDGDKMEEVLIPKETFVKYMLIPMENESKRITIHYINIDGEKTKMAVNDVNEIKDMKEELYRMNN